MSAYLSSNDCMNALVTYWFYKTEGRARDELERALAFSNGKRGDFTAAAVEAKRLRDTASSYEDVVFALLLDANCDSLEARYPGDKDMQDTEGYHFKKSYQTMAWIANDKTANLVGLADGYEYQSCEHEGWKTSTAYQIIEQIRSNLLSDFSKGFRQWASFQEPDVVEDKMPPVSLKELARTQWGNEHLVIVEG